MKIVKIIGIGIAFAIALALIVALFVKKDYAVKREVSIKKPTQEVFDYIRFLKNQENYSAWAKIDPAAKHDFRGTDGTVGFVSAWKSDNKDLGVGEQTILKISDGKRIDYELHFIEPFESHDRAFMSTSADGDSATIVTWGFEGRMKYPMNLMMLFMDMDAMLGKDLQSGLDNLKQILEQK